VSAEAAITRGFGENDPRTAIVRGVLGMREGNLQALLEQVAPGEAAVRRELVQGGAIVAARQRAGEYAGNIAAYIEAERY